MHEMVDLSELKLAKEFGIGCLVVKGAHLWPLSHFVWESSAKNVGATFFGDAEPPWDAANLLRIEVYKLPGRNAEFNDRLEWYTRHRKSKPIKISDGELFREETLHLKGLPSDWAQDSFALSKGEVIRIYQTKKFAIIFRFLARSGTLLDHPIFKRVVKNISFDEHRWVQSVPDVVETRPKSKRSASVPLSDAAMQEVRTSVESVMKRLKLSRIKDTGKKMEVIHNEIDSARANKKLDKDQRVSLAIEVGSFIGQMFCQEMDWEWLQVLDPDGTEAIAVVSGNRALALDPIRWVHELISDKKRANNCLLLFNMIHAGRLPPSRPNSYVWIG